MPKGGLLILDVATGAATLVFAITAVLPGNVAYLILGQFAPPEQVKADIDRLIRRLHGRAPAPQGEGGSAVPG